MRHNTPMTIDNPEQPSLAALILAAADRLDDRLEAEVLVADALGVDRTWLFAHGDESVDPDGLTAIRARIDRRAAGEPVAHILGVREFWSRDFTVTPDVLIPRPATETLVEIALGLDLPDNARVLDLGTGTGCIAVTLGLERTGWRVTATDVSERALHVARDNAARWRAGNVTFVQGRWYEPLGRQSFDLIVSNPPYIAPGDAHLERDDVRFEPSRSLEAANRGLADLETVISGASGHLRPTGWLAVEHGHDQADAVVPALRRAGLENVVDHRDTTGIPRVAVGQFRPA